MLLQGHQNAHAMRLAELLFGPPNGNILPAVAHVVRALSRMLNADAMWAHLEKFGNTVHALAASKLRHLGLLWQAGIAQPRLQTLQHVHALALPKKDKSGRALSCCAQHIGADGAVPALAFLPGNEDAAQLQAAMQRISHLRLEHQSLGDSEINTSILCQQLAVTTQMTYLDLSGNPLRGDRVLTAAMPALQHVNLANSGVGSSTVAALRHCTAVTSLNIAGTDLLAPASEAPWYTPAAHALANLLHLRDVNLNYARLQEPDSDALCSQCLPQLQHLTRLVWQSDSAAHADIGRALLAAVLEHGRMPALQVLDVSSANVVHVPLPEQMVQLQHEQLHAGALRDVALGGHCMGQDTFRRFMATCAAHLQRVDCTAADVSQDTLHWLRHLTWPGGAPPFELIIADDLQSAEEAHENMNENMIDGIVGNLGAAAAIQAGLGAGFVKQRPCRRAAGDADVPALPDEGTESDGGSNADANPPLPVNMAGMPVVDHANAADESTSMSEFSEVSNNGSGDSGSDHGGGGGGDGNHGEQAAGDAGGEGGQGSDGSSTDGTDEDADQHDGGSDDNGDGDGSDSDHDGSDGGDGPGAGGAGASGSAGNAGSGQHCSDCSAGHSANSQQQQGGSGNAAGPGNVAGAPRHRSRLQQLCSTAYGTLALSNTLP